MEILKRRQTSDSCSKESEYKKNLGKATIDKSQKDTLYRPSKKAD